MNLLLLLLGSCRSLAAAAAGLASLRGGGRVLGRGPAGKRAGDAAVVVLLVQGDLASTGPPSTSTVSTGPNFKGPKRTFKLFSPPASGPTHSGWHCGLVTGGHLPRQWQ